jgi:ubiquinone/menaquinone biosynthesis C-methylase UbiE
MSSRNEWQQFFDQYAQQYNDEIFTKNTEYEIQFLIEELNLAQGASILEVGCGTGRHTIPLTKLGYLVTGVDISAAMLDEAHKAAAASGVTLDLVHANIMDFTPKKAYDAAICLCEGALCLLGSGDDPFTRDEEVLRKIYFALKPGGKFIVNVLNACRLIRQYTDEQILEGKFDLLTMTVNNDEEFDTPQGPIHMQGRERVYTQAEFMGMMKRAGFDILHVWGGTAGTWQRQPMKLDEYEFMVVAQR